MNARDLDNYITGHYGEDNQDGCNYHRVVNGGIYSNTDSVGPVRKPGVATGRLAKIIYPAINWILWNILKSDDEFIYPYGYVVHEESGSSPLDLLHELIGWWRMRPRLVRCAYCDKLMWTPGHVTGPAICSYECGEGYEMNGTPAQKLGDAGEDIPF